MKMLLVLKLKLERRGQVVLDEVEEITDVETGEEVEEEVEEFVQQLLVRKCILIPHCICKHAKFEMISTAKKCQKL